ncbi:piggyBac transposable element-derived protein 3-like [Penaeus monodon]|uniref:piggyBac transposable element-derived protein 3-like n=1 Tax=Penaeus monodon TaxID=6687 RepID=UPI0018A7B410|nr:piggyBac transposable element-derived protein 3-like [Penaeus monodon]
MTVLAKKQIYCLGTVRINRLQGISFENDKALGKKGRGTHQENKALVDDVEVRAKKWMDNKGVTLLSTFASAEPVWELKRYDKKAKAVVTVPCPAVVTEYNKFMGGVDLMDSLISLYRIHTRSKKYYHKIFFHFLDVTVVNCWLLYRRDSSDLDIPERKVMMLQEFKLSLAESLLLEGKNPMAKKRGRPSSNGGTAAQFAKKKKSSPATKPIPAEGVRTDGYHHYPVVTTRGRCKNPDCKSAPVLYCQKCKVHLCITKDKNCFVEFHTK